MTRPWAIMRLMNVFGASKNQAQRACLGLTHCAAIGLLTVKGRSPKDLLVAGQALQQLWLVVTTLGLDMHPHNSIAQFTWVKELGGSDLFNRQEQDILNEAFSIFKTVFAKVDFADGETGVFLFRIGNGEPVKGYTLRKDVVCR